MPSNQKGGAFWTKKPCDIVKDVLDLPITQQHKLLIAASLTVESEAKDRVVVDTGDLKQSIAATKTVQSTDAGKKHSTQIIAHADHAAEIETGTGIHGPFKKRITPKVKRAMAWQDKQGNWIVRKSTAGQPAQPFMAPALFETSLKQIKAVETAMKKYLISKNKGSK